MLPFRAGVLAILPVPVALATWNGPPVAQLEQHLVARLDGLASIIRKN